MEFNYSIHDIIKIKSNFLWKKLPNYFLVDKIDKPDITMTIKNINTNSERLTPLGLRIQKGNDFIIHSPRILGNPKLKIKNLHDETKTTEIELTKNYKKIFDLYGSTVGSNVLSDILSSILQIELIQRGYAIIHSACVSKDGSSILISAWSDTGKTTTSMSMINDSFNFMSDDLTIINEDGISYCFPQEIRKNIFNPFEKIPFLNRVRLSKEIDISDKIVDRSIIDKLFFLEKKDTNEVVEINRRETLRKLFISTASTLDFSSNEVIMACSYLDSRINIDNLYEKNRRIVDRMLEAVDCFFEVRTIDSRMFSKLILNKLYDGK